MNHLRRLVRAGASSGWVLAAVVLAVAALTAVALSMLVASADLEALSSVRDEAADRPGEVLLVCAAFLGAFVLRGWLWSRMAPQLPLGHAISGIFVATGANHVLPLRLGEPLRVVSAVSRAGLGVGDATASTVTLRAGDILALLVIGTILGPGVVLDTLGWWGLPVVAAVAAVGFWAWRHLRRATLVGRLRPPDAVTVLGTGAAWLAEAVLVWRVALWAGADISYPDAVLVTAVAVAAQLVAVTPGGVGTYEAAAVTALAVADVPTATAVSVALAVHAAKTVLTVGPGLVAVVLPRPPLYGRLRLPRRVAIPGAAVEPAPQGPVVLFLPAHEEAPRVADVVRRAPSQVGGRPVVVLVVDDGSADGTADAALAAGAQVVRHDVNRGLGAAVATGFRWAVDAGAAAVAFCDADGEYDPAELDRVVAPVLAGDADYVVGSRFAGTIEHMRPHRRAGNLALTRWVAWMSRVPVTDGQSGYRALSRAAADAAVVAHDYNYAQVLTLDLARKGFRYVEVPITYRFRTSGRSFVRLTRYLRRCVPAAWRVVNDRVGAPPAPSAEAVVAPPAG